MIAGRKRLLALVCLPLILALAAYLAGLGGLDADMLLARRAWLAGQVEAHPVAAALTYCAAYILGMSLALPLGGVLAILAGFLFGRWPGLALVVGAGTVSASLVFWLARRFAGDRPLDLDNRAVARLADAMRRHGFLSVLAMRIIPAFPFFVVTLVAALAGIGFRAFVVATVIGKVPASLIYIGLGRTLGEAGSLEDVVTTESLVGLSCLGLLALAPIAARAVWRRRGGRRDRQAASRTGPRLEARRPSVNAS